MRTPALQLISLDLTSGTAAARIAACLRLRGADSVCVVTAHSLQVPLVTWDQEFLTRAAGYIQVINP